MGGIRNQMFNGLLVSTDRLRLVVYKCTSLLCLQVLSNMLSVRRQCE